MNQKYILILIICFISICSTNFSVLRIVQHKGKINFHLNISILGVKIDISIKK